MSKTVISTSTSVDGFIRAAGATPDEPLGKGGERLHHWVFNGTDEDHALLQERPRDASGRRMQRDWSPTAPVAIVVAIVARNGAQDG